MHIIRINRIKLLLTSVFTAVLVVEVLVTGLGDLAVVVVDNDLFRDFSFNGELAGFSTADVESRTDVFAADGDLAVVAEVDFTVKLVGFGGALNKTRKK